MENNGYVDIVPVKVKILNSATSDCLSFATEVWDSVEKSEADKDINLNRGEGRLYSTNFQFF